MVHPKQRSLRFGMPAGMHFQDIDGRRVLLLSDVPYELEDIIMNWILALSVTDRLTVLHERDGKAIGLSDEGWDAFLSWMLHFLMEARFRPDFEEQANALFHSQDHL